LFRIVLIYARTTSFALAKASIFFLSVSLALSEATSAAEKIFISANNTCYFVGGQVWGDVKKENFYSELLGSLQGVSTKMCFKGSFLNARTCISAILYNFRIACRGGLATAPQFYMAMFGNDESTRKNGFILANNQLSYIDPIQNAGTSGQRVAFPYGYAPFEKPIDGVVKRLTWDDYHQRPLLTHIPDTEHERRIQNLFVSGPGYVEPFPESNIKLAFEISEERIVSPPPPLPPPPFQPGGGGFSIGANSGLAVGGSLVFVAFLSWAFGFVSRMLSGDRPKFWRQVGVESAVLIISGTVLFWFGIVDEIKLLSIPLVGGLSVAVISSLRST
jgi:hypothetical protein